MLSFYSLICFQRHEIVKTKWLKKKYILSKWPYILRASAKRWCAMATLRDGLCGHVPHRIRRPWPRYRPINRKGGKDDVARNIIFLLLRFLNEKYESPRNGVCIDQLSLVLFEISEAWLFEERNEFCVIRLINILGLLFEQTN